MSLHAPGHEPEPDDAIDAVDFYWRRGCPFCTALRRRLERTGVPIRYHDIWSDDDAAARVRSVAGGNETVPTIGIGDHMLVNPSARAVMASLEELAPGLVPEESPPRPLWQRWYRGR